MKKISLMLVLTLVASALFGCAAPADAQNAEYIGVDRAKQIALENAGIAETDADGINAELDRESTYAVYEITFDAAGYDYEYDVDAATGEIVRVKRAIDDEARLPAATSEDRTPYKEPEPAPDAPEPAVTEPAVDTEPAPATEPEPPATEPAPATEPEPPATEPAPPATQPAAPSDPEYIGYDAAIDAALKHAGVSRDNIYDLDAEIDRERGVVVYDVSFDSDGYDYDYEIDAVTGDVLRSDKERDGDYRQAASKAEQSASSSYIGIDKAKQIALDHAGLSSSEVRDLEVELENEHGTMIYEVCFDSAGYEYEYDINASTGEIINNKKERD